MAIDKSRTSPFVKGMIIFLAVTFVLGIAGTAFVPLLESIFNPSKSTGTGTGTGSKNTTDTVAAAGASYAARIQANDNTLKTDPKNYDTLVNQGQAYQDWAGAVVQANGGQPGTSDRPLWLLSVDYYKKALAVKAGDPGVTTDMSIAMLYSGDTAGAISIAEGVVKANPKFAQAFFNLGVFYSVNGENAKAVAAYQEYVKLEPSGSLVSDANSRIKQLQSLPTTTTP